MASLVEELVNVLREEEKIYQVFWDLAQKKSDILIQADVPALEKMTAIEQVKSDELLAYSNKQISLLQDIGTVLGKQDETMTVTKLISLMESQPKVQMLLKEARDQLLDIAKRVQELNRQNEILLQQAIELAEFDITLFKSMRQAPQTANYNKSAYNTGDILGSSGFDAKQ